MGFGRRKAPLAQSALESAGFMGWLRPRGRPPQFDLGARGLFVIGFARSGTTVLQNALNDSDAIFLFGEPNFHRDPGTRDFARRYNFMHREWGNQPSKSTYCPLLFKRDAPWHAYLARLAQFHRHVGAKIVVTPYYGGAGIAAILAFQCRHFYGAHHVFTFRNPRDVLVSTQGLETLLGNAASPPELVLSTYVSVIRLFLHMRRTMPNISAVFHETMGPEIFVDLGGWLGTKLDGAAAYYDTARVKRYALGAVPDMFHARLAEVEALYNDFSGLLRDGLERVQLEQNIAHLDAFNHLTRFGEFAWRVDRMIAAFAEAPSVAGA